MKAAAAERKPPGRPKGTLRGLTPQNGYRDRSKGGSLHQLMFWVPRDVLDEIKRAAASEGRLQRDVIVDAIRSYGKAK